MTIGKRIRTLRKKYKLTQAELGKMLDKGDSTVRMWELDRSQPDNKTLLRLSELFGISVDYLLGKSEYPEPGLPPKELVGDGGFNPLMDNIDEQARAIFNEHPQYANLSKEHQESVLVGIKVGMLSALGSKPNAVMLKALGADETLIDFLLKYMELGAEGQEYVRKSLDLSLGIKEGGETEK